MPYRLSPFVMIALNFHRFDQTDQYILRAKYEHYKIDSVHDVFYQILMLYHNRQCNF